MKANLIITGVLVSVGIATAAYFYSRPESVAPSDQSTNAEPLSYQETNKNRASKPEAVKTQPTIATDETSPDGSALEAEIIDEFEIVEGIRVKKDRDCTVKVHYMTNKDGSVVKLYSCEPNKKKPIDIYQTYSNETLETMAYADAHAAHILSTRFYQKDLSRAVGYAIRSSALAGNGDAINWIIAHYPHADRQDQIARFKTLEDKYVLTGLLHQLNYNNQLHLNATARLNRHEGYTPDFEELEHRINTLHAEIENVRSQVGID